MTGATLGIRIGVTGSSGRALRDAADAGRATERASGGAARGLRLWAAGLRQTNAGVQATTRAMGRFTSAGRGLFGMLRGAGTATRNMVSNLFTLKNAVLGMLALAAGGSLFDKLIGSNAKLQSQELGLAATLNANLVLRDAKTGKELTGGAGFMAAQKVSKDLQKQFEKDALNAPGSSSELAMLFQAGLNPALQAGKSVDQMRVTAKEAMTFSKIIGNDIPQASRDLQLLFTGNAGMDNRTWQMLGATVGLTAEQFNKLPAPERFDRIKKAMQQFATKDVIDAYAGSWDGLTSSMGDLIDQTTRSVGAPVFKELSGLLREAIGWMTNPANKAGIDAFAKSLGMGIANAIRFLVAILPKLWAWGSRAFEFFGDIASSKLFTQFLGIVQQKINFIIGLPWGEWLGNFFAQTQKLTSSQGFKAFVKMLIDGVSTVLRLPWGEWLSEVFGVVSNFVNGSSGKDLVAFLGQMWTKIQMVLALPWAQWFNSAVEAIAPFVGWIVQGYTNLANDLIPTVQWFGKQIGIVFGAFNQWLTDNKAMLSEAGEGLKTVGGWLLAVRDAVAKLVVKFAGFVALGLAALFTGIATAVIFVLSKVRSFAAFVMSIPSRIKMAVNDMKASFLGLGLELTKMVKQIPILGQLFGAVDLGAGLSKGLERQIQDLKRANRQTDLELRAVDPSNPKAQTDAQKQLQRAGERNLDMSSNVTINNTQNISTSDPVTAANAANRGVQAAVNKGVSSNPARRGNNAVSQMVGR